VGHRRLYEEHFALSEEDTVRGCYIFKYQSARATRGSRNEQAEIVRGFSRWADDLWNACKGVVRNDRRPRQRNLEHLIL
jgi:hypothetical protein